MAGTIVADTWQNGDGTQNYKCRAWVNFDGTGTVAIRASGNVSSITDNGTGSYTMNFTNAMVDTNYSLVGTNGDNATANNHVSAISLYRTTGGLAGLQTVNSIRVNTNFDGQTNTLTDVSTVMLSIFR